MRKKTTVLFVCTNNSARSQMAEGILRHLHGERYEVYSAGTEPTVVNPLAIDALHEIGIDISHHTSKGLDAFKGIHIDLVITVCDRANQTCPIVPGAAKTIHKSFEDPVGNKGLASFRKTRDDIRDWIVQTFQEQSPGEDTRVKP